jgi:hypothetical protein
MACATRSTCGSRFSLACCRRSKQPQNHPLDFLKSRKTEALALQHDTLAADARAQFKEVIEALRALMRPPEPARRPIGFVTPQEKKSR